MSTGPEGPGIRRSFRNASAFAPAVRFLSIGILAAQLRAVRPFCPCRHDLEQKQARRASAIAYSSSARKRR